MFLWLETRPYIVFSGFAASGPHGDHTKVCFCCSRKDSRPSLGRAHMAQSLAFHYHVEYSASLQRRRHGIGIVCDGDLWSVVESADDADWINGDDYADRVDDELAADSYRSHFFG